jgi:hypothetical protein
MYVSTDEVRRRSVAEGTSFSLSTSTGHGGARQATATALYPLVLRHLPGHCITDRPILPIDLSGGFKT